MDCWEWSWRLWDWSSSKTGSKDISYKWYSSAAPVWVEDWPMWPTQPPQQGFLQICAEDVRSHQNQQGKHVSQNLPSISQNTVHVKGVKVLCQNVQSRQKYPEISFPLISVPLHPVQVGGLELLSPWLLPASAAAHILQLLPPFQHLPCNTVGTVPLNSTST